MVVQVVNFPFCNFYSLERYLRISSHAYQVLSDAHSLSVSDIIILPGVGTFRQGMDYLRETGLTSIILNHASNGGRVIGICLGMQMLLNSSSESPGVEGLSLIPGACERIPAFPSFSVPHIGWNSLTLPETPHPTTTQYGIHSSLSCSDFYFVHSYVAVPSVDGAIIAAFNHPSGELAAAIGLGCVMGFQFHPEKSGTAGYSLLDNVLGR